jgi:hypothetical protein
MICYRIIGGSLNFLRKFSFLPTSYESPVKNDSRFTAEHSRNLPVHPLGNI